MSLYNIQARSSADLTAWNVLLLSWKSLKHTAWPCCTFKVCFPCPQLKLLNLYIKRAQQKDSEKKVLSPSSTASWGLQISQEIFLENKTQHSSITELLHYHWISGVTWLISQHFIGCLDDDTTSTVLTGVQASSDWIKLSPWVDGVPSRRADGCYIQHDMPVKCSNIV